MTIAPATTSTTSSPGWSPRYATPRDPTRETRGLSVLAHLTRLRRRAPYRWQWEVAETAGELADDGHGFRYQYVVLSVPRRAGKTTLDLAVNLDGLDIIADARGWYTAQARETAAKLFRDEWSPMVEPLSHLYRLRRSQGSEGIHKRRGSSRLQIFAPTETALHSTNADIVTIDEAWAFDIIAGEGVESGIRPAQLTRPWRQTWIVSAGGTVESTWFDRWLTAGEGGTPGVALFDYGADPTDPGYDPSSPGTWLQAHPTAGVAFPLEVLAHEWATRADDASFERAYLNVWPRPSRIVAAAGLELAQWSAAAHPRRRPERVTAIAFDVAADRSAAAVAIAGPHPAGIVVELVDARPGLGWLAARVKAVRAQHRGAIVYADSLVAASVVAELRRVGVTVNPVGAGDHARACGTFVDLLARDGLAHRSQAALDDAVAAAARRPLGDAWLWSRSRSNADISPLVAATIAVWGAHSRRPAGKPSIVAPESADYTPRRPARIPVQPRK